MIDLCKEMFLQVGCRLYPIATFAQASQMFCTARDAFGEGASTTPTPLIVDGAGSVIGHVSYNGRVWPGADWAAGATPLYQP
jgi:hypothetical protein